MLSALSRKGLKVKDASQVTPGWDGSTPFSLKFGNYPCHEFVVILGRCTSGPEQAVLGPHFLAVQEGSDLMPRDPSHNCKEDHAEAGTTRRWRHQEVGPRWKEPHDLQVSLTRSRFSDDSANMLEVHIEVVEDLEGPIAMAQNRVRLFLHPPLGCRL